MTERARLLILVGAATPPGRLAVAMDVAAVAAQLVVLGRIAE